MGDDTGRPCPIAGADEQKGGSVATIIGYLPGFVNFSALFSSLRTAGTDPCPEDR